MFFEKKKLKFWVQMFFINIKFVSFVIIYVSFMNLVILRVFNIFINKVYFFFEDKFIK